MMTEAVWDLQYLLDWLQIAETGNEEDDLMPNLVVSMIYLDFCACPDRVGLTLTPEGRVLRDLLEKGAEAWRASIAYTQGGGTDGATS